MVNDINGHPAVVVEVDMPRTFIEEGQITLSYADLSLGSACVVFSILIYEPMNRTVVSRLSELDASVKKISAQGDPSLKLSVSGDDDIASLSTSINNMLDELDSKSEQLQKSERFSAIGELATMVAHDLRNPLQGIANAAFYLKRSRKTGVEEKKMVSLIEEDVKYADKIVNDLLDYSRDVRLELRETNPKSLIQDTLAMVTVPVNVRVENKTDDEPLLKLDIDRIKRAFINIVNNAIDAMPEGGTLTIGAKDTDGMVDFMFADSGRSRDDEGGHAEDLRSSVHHQGQGNGFRSVHLQADHRSS